MNLLDVDLSTDGGLQLGGVAVPIEDKVSKALAERGSGTYAVGVRPEHLQFGDEGIPGEVIVVEELGSESFVHVTVEHQGEPLLLVVRAEGETSIQRGDNVRARFIGPVHVFDSEG